MFCLECFHFFGLKKKKSEGQMEVYTKRLKCLTPFPREESRFGLKLKAFPKPWKSWLQIRR